MKGVNLSTEQIGGTEFRENHRNVNYELNKNNNNISFNNEYQHSLNQPKPVNHEINSYIDMQNKNSLINIYKSQLPSIYNNFVNGYNYDQMNHFQLHQKVEDYPKKTTMNKVFGSIYLNDFSRGLGENDSDYYSRRKVQMVKDYNNMLNKNDEIEFKRNQLQKRSVEQGINAKRLDDMQSSFSPSESNFYEYNKRYDLKTVFDDKKILNNKAFFGNYYPANHNTVNY